ncbi:hypothetical protein [Clostridium sp.]|uniref:hypothetical protein n=1 Tax=Clostridium sp. TaxID=1506 RepID=UPI0025C5AADE|nr:hypothetical protein [Clostridium sp.]
MINKNDFTIYRKYEDDGRYFDYNYDMIINRILEVIEGLEIEDKIEEYIDDLEEVVEQMVDEFNATISDLDDLQEDYDDLEEEKEDLEREIRYLKDMLEE